jgi:hypothetical protein
LAVVVVVEGWVEGRVWLVFVIVVAAGWAMARRKDGIVIGLETRLLQGLLLPWFG